MWWGICIRLCYKFPFESNRERILKIGQYLVKLWARVRCRFFDSRCIHERARLILGLALYAAPRHLCVALFIVLSVLSALRTKTILGVWTVGVISVLSCWPDQTSNSELLQTEPACSRCGRCRDNASRRSPATWWTHSRRRYAAATRRR